MRKAHSARAWDLLSDADARAFLSADGLASRRGELPLPCRAVRITRSAQIDPARLARELPDGVTVLVAERALVIAGPTRQLLETARRWPEPPGSLLADLLARYDHPPPRLAFADGACWELAGRVRLMGILNLTPDSFSDGGLCADPTAALARAETMVTEGADIIDLGGESTRPGAEPVDDAEEERRVLPVLSALRREFPAMRLSVDTRRAHLAHAALSEGADMINDVSGLEDPEMTPIVAAAGCPLVVMHMRGTPQQMQKETHYDDLLTTIIDALREKTARAIAAGIEDDRLIVDPGVGFGKSALGNEELLRQLGSLRSLGHAILIGVSRKMFIGKRSSVAEPAKRLAGSLAAATAAVLAGARIVRVHDLRASREALAIADALRRWPAREDPL